MLHWKISYLHKENVFFAIISQCRKWAYDLTQGWRRVFDVFRALNSTQLNSASSENVQNFATGKKLSDFQFFFSWVKLRWVVR